MSTLKKFITTEQHGKLRDLMQTTIDFIAHFYDGLLKEYESQMMFFKEKNTHTQFKKEYYDFVLHGIFKKYLEDVFNALHVFIISPPATEEIAAKQIKQLLENESEKAIELVNATPLRTILNLLNVYYFDFTEVNLKQLEHAAKMAIIKFSQEPITDIYADFTDFGGLRSRVRRSARKLSKNIKKPRQMSLKRRKHRYFRSKSLRNRSSRRK